MESPDPPPAAPPSSSLLDFFLIVGKLKTTKRTGWVNRNIALPESIADHMYRMSIICFFLSDTDPATSSPTPPPRPAHLVKLALVHDLAEAIVGDITPFDGVSKEEKYRREEAAMRALCGPEGVAGGVVGAEMYVLWREYEAGETMAARVVKDVDKFEMLLQAYEYEGEQGVGLEEFFESTRGRFGTEQVKALVEVLESRRNERKRGENGTQGEGL